MLEFHSLIEIANMKAGAVLPFDDGVNMNIDPPGWIQIVSLPLSRYVSLGNSCIGGATMALTAGGSLEEIDTIRDRITYLELNVNQEFMPRFSAARFLPHTDLSRFPSVKVRRNG